MDSPVRITADITGAVIGRSNNNEEFGYIRIQQVARKIGKGGWLTFSKRSALLKGRMEDLHAANFKEGDIIPGKIVVKESLEPFYAEDPDKHLKRAGENGIPCTLHDQPIYRDSIYTINMEEEDVLIEHDNSEDIKNNIAECNNLTTKGGLEGLKALVKA